MEITTKSTKETFKLGEQLALKFKPQIPVFLYGDLGAGKTELIKGICFGLGYGGRVLSPTFQLVREYKARFKIYHIDLYRLEGENEMRSVGLEDYFADEKAIVLLEWADRLDQKNLQKPRVEIKISIVSEKERKFDILNV